MSVIHPAHEMSYDELLGGLHTAIADGHVKIRTKGSLAIYHYTETCQFDRIWTPFTRIARGIVLDHAARKIVATPFPKFFNYGECGRIESTQRADGTELYIALSDYAPLLPKDEPFEIYEKLDGSLGIVFFHDGEWHITTKGTFDAEQAVQAKKMLKGLHMKYARKGCTYLFEIIGPWNQIVVPYEQSELVLLGVYTPDGVEHTDDLELRMIADALGCRTPDLHTGKTLADLLELAKTIPRTEEGFVVRFASGLRVKIKGDAYVRAHKLASRVTPLGVWEALYAGDDMNALRVELPEELHRDFDEILRLLSHEIERRVTRGKVYYIESSSLSNKEVGLSTDIPADEKWKVFALRQGKDLLTDMRSRRTLFEGLRPTSNKLEGYTPSTALNRFKE
jgi:RNA ligase